MSSPLRKRVAILEANNFHEEVLFAFASSAERVSGGADITVFAPDHWRSREFLRDNLKVACAWHSFEEFMPYVHARNRELFDLVIVNTFPSPAGQHAIEGALGAGNAVLGLVHDIDFLTDPGGARAALERHGNLRLAHAGPAASSDVYALPTEHPRRIVRFFPVFRFGTEAEADNDRQRAGVALPGAIEFGRRDISTALRLTAETRAPLKIVGRSYDHGNGPKVPRDLEAERQRLFDEIAALPVTPSVSISTDVSCSDFYRAIYSSRFVAVMPANPAYLKGKLTGAVTAAMSCRVPMLATRDVHAFYTETDPSIFSACMIPFDPYAPAGRGDDWGSIVLDMQPGPYEELSRATKNARDVLLKENSMTIEHTIAARRSP